MSNATNSLSLSQFYPENLPIQSICDSEDVINIILRSITKKSICPICKEETSNLHATHHRKVQDLPIYGKRTMLDINLYEFDCINPDCSVTSFTETFIDFKIRAHPSQLVSSANVIIKSTKRSVIVL